MDPDNHPASTNPADPGEDWINVEVAYGLPDRQFLEMLWVPPGTTALEAVERSGLREAFPEAVIEPDALGIFSRKVTPDQVLKANDRVEVYRSLTIDPKEARRLRAESSKP